MERLSCARQGKTLQLRAISRPLSVIIKRRQFRSPYLSSRGQNDTNELQNSNSQSKAALETKAVSAQN